MKTEILIINNGLSGGGIERASVSLANYFQSIGLKVSVVALYPSEKFFKLNEEIFFQEPNFTRVHLNKYIYLIKMMLFLRKAVKKINPHTILSFSEWTNPYVVLALTNLNYPLYLSDRMSPLAKLPIVSELFRKLLYKKSKGIIAQSNFAKSVLREKTNSLNITVIYNPVNVIEKIDCLARNRIVSVGRLEEVKGHQYLIRAFAMLNNHDWELSIVGDGTLKKELEELAYSLGIGDKIIFHGHLKDFKMQLSEAEIFVLPSLSEGFPNALIEAMSVPLACIASDTFNGFNEIIENGKNGILVEPGNVSELADAMKMLMQDRSFRNQLKSSAIEVRETLNFERIANQYLEVILK